MFLAKTADICFIDRYRLFGAKVVVMVPGESSLVNQKTENSENLHCWETDRKCLEQVSINANRSGIAARGVM